MYFSTTVVLAALPFLVAAAPTQKSARSGLSIPLSKRSTLLNANGVVDVQNLQASVRHTITFVFPFFFFFEKGRILTKCPLRKFEQGFEAFESSTGEPHPLAPRQDPPKIPEIPNFPNKPKVPNKPRGGGAISLTNYHNTMWYGNISVGTPAAPYIGRSLFRVART